MPKKERVFQFSNTEKSEHGENELKKFKEIILHLGATYDESINYSESATHLIVGEETECTEKVLCFTAAGKHILRRTYLKESLNRKMFLDEKDFHISKRNQGFNWFYFVSRWFEKIVENSENAPFANWNIGCFIETEKKSEALLRIIKAGHGNATNILNESYDARINKFTLLIYENGTKDSAIKYSLQLGIPCYPFQCIPDYLMQAEKSDLPHYPITYYTNFEKSSPILTNRDSLSIQFSEPCSFQTDDQKVTFENVTSLDDSLFREDFFIRSTYDMFLLSSNQESCGSEPSENCLEAQFFTLWTNGAYNEALNLLTLLERNVLPLENTLVLLFEFIINGTLRQKQSDSNELILIYKSIYSIILNVILNHPPVNDSKIEYYSSCFDKLNLNNRIESAELNPKGMVDLVFLLTVHDFLLLSWKGVKEMRLVNYRSKCLLKKLNYSRDLVFKKMIRQVNADKNSSALTYHKLFQIIYFSNRYICKSKLLTQLETQIAGCSDVSNLTYQRVFTQLA